MIRSMTGYGTATIKNDFMDIKIDMRSVNNRYLDIHFKSPKFLLFLEDELKKIISSKITRGKIDVFVDIKLLGDKDMDLNIDYNLLEAYRDKIKLMSEHINSPFDLNIMELLNYDHNILSSNRVDLSEDDNFINTCKECVEITVNSLLEMKAQEGYNIEYDLKNKLNDLHSLLEKIKLLSKDVVDINMANLRKRIGDILSSENIEIDEDRFMNELVYYTDKLTIDEELVRLKSHFDLFNNYLESDKFSGKKFDFLIQEMNREVNTIGSKSGNIDITNSVIDMKSIIENMREQVQNIE